MNREEEEIGVREGGKRGKDTRERGKRWISRLFFLFFVFVLVFGTSAKGRTGQGDLVFFSFPFLFFCLLFLFHSFISRPLKGLMMMMIY